MVSIGSATPKIVATYYWKSKGRLSIRVKEKPVRFVVARGDNEGEECEPITIIRLGRLIL